METLKYTTIAELHLVAKQLWVFLQSPKPPYTEWLNHRLTRNENTYELNLIPLSTEEIEEYWNDIIA